ncbi:hypothetical protein BSKO_07981 [Bryopsis sp. KO-2023]|nr:hypothetical protein BSKO_07981 [Bryopsis sp. KO-2023]
MTRPTFPTAGGPSGGRLLGQSKRLPGLHHGKHRTQPFYSWRLTQILAMSQWALEANRGGVYRKEFVPCRRLHLSSGLNAGQRPCGQSRAVASGQDDAILHRPLARPQKPDQDRNSSTGVTSPPTFRPTSNSFSQADFEDLVEEACTSLDNGGNTKEIITLFSTKFLHMLENGRFRSSRLVHMMECVSTVITTADVQVSLVPESSRLVLNLTRQIDDNLQEFSGRELSTIFRCYGKLGSGVIELHGNGVRVREMMSHLCLQTESVLHTMDPDQVSQMVWGLARMKFTHCDGLLEDLVYRAAPQVKEGAFYPRQIATLAWAIGKLGFRKGPMLIKALSRQAKGHMGEFTPQEIMRFLWGISQLGFRGVPSVLDAARNEVNRRAEEFNISDLIDVTFAFGRLVFNPGLEYMDRVGARLCRENDDLSAEDVTKLLYSFAVQGYSSDCVMTWTRENFLSNVGKYRVKNVATFLWSYAILGGLDGEIFALGVNRMAHSSEELDATAMNQVYQSWLHLTYMSDEVVPEGSIPADFLARCRKAWLSQRKQPPVRAAGSIMEVLRGLGYTCHKRMSIKGGDFCMDAIEDGEGRSVVVDVTILTHCFVNDPDRVRPSREWFWRVYEKLGFKVLQIKEDQWKQVPVAAKGKFIQRKLDEVLQS